MANLLRVRTVVQQTLAKQDAERTNHFLHAASSGDAAKIRQVGCEIHFYHLRILAGMLQAMCAKASRKPLIWVQLQNPLQRYATVPATAAVAPCRATTSPVASTGLLRPVHSK